MSVIRSVYLLEIEQEYFYDVRRAFSWSDIDWSGTMMPVECLGTFRTRMLVTAIAPMGVVGLGVFARLGAGRVRGEAMWDSLLSCIEPFLLIVFLLAPGVSRTIFRAWDCALCPAQASCKT